MDEESLTAATGIDVEAPTENTLHRVVWVEIVDIEPVEGEPDFEP